MVKRGTLPAFRTGRLIRPSAIYTGPGERPAQDIEGWNDAWGKTDASEEPVA